MRTPLLDDATAMTLTGRPAVTKPLFVLPLPNVGDMILFHFPSSWNHFAPDHVI